MTQSNAKNEQPQEPQLQFSQEQYDMLMRCSKRGDITEWNEWRKDNPNVEIHLQGAGLVGATLQGANLVGATLQGAKLERAKLQGAKLWRANLQRAKLEGAKLQGARLWGANMQSANLRWSNLQGTNLFGANVKEAMGVEGNLQGADLREADLRSATFRMAAVDGETVISGNTVDKKTDFTGVGLDAARVDPGIKQLLKYNIRRLRWEEWYEDHSLLRWPVQMFWEMSDYGASTLRIIRLFFEFAALFALIYLRWPHFLMVNGDIGAIRGFWHALYFSVVTMTTLGFGDIHANPDNWVGQGLLMLQVLLGYILLAALVTRFAVLFQAGGPAGKFARKVKD